ncbi:MAG: DinB family protein [Actinobacteria bacterium]|nr:DinB family protein [Actinomycetota bacterium]
MARTQVCPECGLDYGRLQPPDLKVAVRSFPRRFRQALAAARDDDGGDALIRRRPDPVTWSALEYTAHVAGVFESSADMVRRIYHEDRPTLEEVGANERPGATQGEDQDPAAVLERLSAGAERLAAQLDGVDPEGWQRQAVTPSGARDLLDVARQAVHEGSHHLRDVDKVLAAARRARIQPGP